MVIHKNNNKVINLKITFYNSLIINKAHPLGPGRATRLCFFNMDRGEVIMLRSEGPDKQVGFMNEQAHSQTENKAAVLNQNVNMT